jgi:hypothetical protein
MLGKVLIGLGVTILVIGLVVHFFPGALKWFGRLPGDIHIERGHTKVFFPIMSMIVISLVLTLIINLFFRR